MAKSRFVVTLFPLGMLCCALVTQSCPTLCDPTDCSLLGSSVDGDSLGKNTVVGCHALLQGTFPTKGSKAGLPQGRQILYHLSYRASLRILQWVADPFFLTQKSNQGLQHCTWILYQLSYQGSPPSQYQFSCLVVSDSMTPWIAARQPSLSITNSWSLLKLMSIESVMLLWITCICIRCTCIWITGGCHSGESFGFYDWGGATVTSVYMPEILLNILSPQNSLYLKELSGPKYPYCLDLEKAKELEIKLPASIGS